MRSYILYILMPQGNNLAHYLCRKNHSFLSSELLNLGFMDLGFIRSLFTISRPPHAIPTAQANSIHDSKDAVLEGAELWNLRVVTFICVVFSVGEQKTKRPQFVGFLINQKVSNEKNPGWLGNIRDYTTQVYRDYNKP